MSGGYTSLNHPLEHVKLILVMLIESRAIDFWISR